MSVTQQDGLMWCLRLQWCLGRPGPAGFTANLGAPKHLTFPDILALLDAPSSQLALVIHITANERLLAVGYSNT